MISARYLDRAGARIEVVYNGKAIVVPASSNNAVFNKLAADNIYIHPYVQDDRPVISARADYSALVDSDAERIRWMYITPGAGMAMTYQEKFAQAQAVAEMGEAAANALSATDREAQFPTLSASVGIEAGTLYECAQLVLEKYATFARVSLAIERARLSGKAAIAAAQNADDARAAYEAITWPMP